MASLLATLHVLNLVWPSLLWSCYSGIVLIDKLCLCSLTVFYISFKFFHVNTVFSVFLFAVCICKSTCCVCNLQWGSGTRIRPTTAEPGQLFGLWGGAWQAVAGLHCWFGYGDQWACRWKCKEVAFELMKAPHLFLTVFPFRISILLTYLSVMLLYLRTRESFF